VTKNNFGICGQQTLSFPLQTFKPSNLQTFKPKSHFQQWQQEIHIPQTVNKIYRTSLILGLCYQNNLAQSQASQAVKN
jgi:hypothetical protein